MSQTTSNSLYLQVKPAGAYHCVCDANQDAASRIVSYLLGQETTPLFSLESIAAWLDGNEPKAREILRHMQKLQWLQWVSEPQSVKDGKLEDILPGILAPLSMSEKSLLADNQGFYIASNGIPHETAEELSALSADLASLYERHRGLLNGNLNRPDNWAIVDAAGFSQLGFWPLHVGNELFFLVVDGMPRFDHPNFMQLVWVLCSRYAPFVNTSPAIPVSVGSSVSASHNAG
ncbi:MAG: hypothetical protein CSA49_06885 [Gammaproteobacteria bacterium]|nr:MAG: hypothetical protein CSA49_06885 [Gammaproteobacteria bacterium]